MLDSLMHEQLAVLNMIMSAFKIMSAFIAVQVMIGSLWHRAFTPTHTLVGIVIQCFDGSTINQHQLATLKCACMQATNGSYWGLTNWLYFIHNFSLVACGFSFFKSCSLYTFATLTIKYTCISIMYVLTLNLNQESVLLIKLSTTISQHKTSTIAQELGLEFVLVNSDSDWYT